MQWQKQQGQKTRIGMAKTAFMELKRLRANTRIHTKTRMKVIVIWSVLINGVETWTISREIEESWKLPKCGLYRDS